MASDRKLTVVIEVAPKGGAAGSNRRVAQLVKDALPGGQFGVGNVFRDSKPTAAVESVTTGFSNMTKELKRLEAAQRPDLLKKQADLEIKLADAKLRYNKALEAEKNKLAPMATVAPKGMLQQLLGGIFGGGAGGLGELFGGGIGAGGGFLAAAGPAGVALGAVALGLEKIVDWGGKAAQVTIGLVGKANPAIVERLTMAWDDLEATMGHRLAPVVDFFTQTVRLAGDALNTILPNASEFKSVMAELDPVFADIREVVGDVGPILRTGLVSALRQTAFALKLVYAAAKPFIELAKLAAGPGNLIGQLFGGGKGAAGVRSSVGAAARSASFLSAEALAERGYASAYSMGLTPAAKTAENTSAIAEAAKGIWDWLTGGDKGKEGNDRGIEGVGGEEYS